MRLENVKIVGKSGQIALGKRFAGKRFRVDYRDDGSLVLTSVVMVPESELWTLKEPHRSRIERGLAWAAKNPPAETDLEALMKKAGLRSKARRRRGARR
jgi:chromosomal replication initiation ATPase DnaA